MNLNLKTSFILIIYFILSCNAGKLEVVANLPTSLPEISAVEKLPKSDVLWVIQDAGNNNHLYGLGRHGEIVKDVTISNATNVDWEDLTSDNRGNIYIGDFGNNSLKRKTFTIYKVNVNSNSKDLKADVIEFHLPKKEKTKDFEAFFLYENNFYIFSKETTNFKTLKVPNKVGKHMAVVISEFNLKGKKNRITSAAISSNGKHIYLLNHDKVWEVSNFSLDSIFKGKIKSLEFNHDTQKEGICLKNSSTLYITDEFKKNKGGNLYEFKIR